MLKTQFDNEATAPCSIPVRPAPARTSKAAKLMGKALWLLTSQADVSLVCTSSTTFTTSHYSSRFTWFSYVFFVLLRFLAFLETHDRHDFQVSEEINHLHGLQDPETRLSFGILQFYKHMSTQEHTVGLDTADRIGVVSTAHAGRVRTIGCTLS